MEKLLGQVRKDGAQRQEVYCGERTVCMHGNGFNSQTRCLGHALSLNPDSWLQRPPAPPPGLEKPFWLL